MGRSRILVVDDVRYIAHFLKYHLEKAGYEVMAVHSGEGALCILESFRPDGLLVDVVFPSGISGLEVCKAVRSGQHASKAVIIIMSAHAFDVDAEATAEEATAAGANAYLAKPVSPFEVVRRFSELGVLPTTAGVGGEKKP